MMKSEKICSVSTAVYRCGLFICINQQINILFYLNEKPQEKWILSVLVYSRVLIIQGNWGL